MIEWSEQHLMIRDMMRRFIDEEIKPKWHDLEHGDLPPYDILRKLMKTFGIDEMARQRFAKQIAREKAVAAGEKAERRSRARRRRRRRRPACRSSRSSSCAAGARGW